MTGKSLSAALHPAKKKVRRVSILFQHRLSDLADRHLLPVEETGRQRRFRIGLLKYINKMPGRALTR